MAESLFNKWDSVVAPVRNELVFEDRNKEYGAFEIRKNHNKNVLIALIITGLSFTLVVSLPAIIAWIQNVTEEVEVPVDITPLDLTAPPPLDETEPLPPPPPPPPVMETVKFTALVVTDEQVDDAPPVQDAETPQISTVTQEGTSDDAIIIPVETNAVVEVVEEAPLTFVQQMPTFPGGEAKMMEYLQQNLKYPQVEKENGISGTCYVTFVVEKDGSITGAKIIRAVPGGPGCDKAALKVVNSMPKWAVGKQNGREVRVQFNLPIKFTLK